ncbi:uncharacterized protein LOC128438537 [Pleuronectes platessa]|uniref:uncharacterized protein LOC128438537 n=1 Tax=Pleuronectes platessa TaxID=8262 RepID=UPI00232A64A4|nr:uncharacterized protein LOC128438537 [Pleuronectes platessa]
MFSRNRFNGQHGAGVSPKGGTKTKVQPPKKRAPNPRVALVIRGKIHRLLQGSADHHVPESQHYYAGIEDEEAASTTEESRQEHRRTYPKVSQRTGDYPPKVPNGKEHGVASGPPCVGEVELNREGCLRIPCTLQHRVCRSPANRKRISFESDTRIIPEQMRPPYSPSSPDMNGSKYAGAAGREFASPRSRPKRPYSTGDCLDYNFNRALPGTLLEEDEDKEEESSAIIDHILKELRGINKIQEEISDLRDYLTSVRGSVEEVSSCVDAVLLEIEGIRSNKAGSGAHASTWSGAGCKDGSSPRRRPASAYGSLGSAKPKSDLNLFHPVCSERHSVHGELMLPRSEESTVSPIAESVDHQDLEEPDDNSDHSSDIPVGAIARKLSFGYLGQDGHDYPSTSSLSSGHSSKSESDLDRPLSSHGRKQQRAEDREEHWTNTGPPHSATAESVWHQESYLRDRRQELHEDDCKGAGSWDHYSVGGYGTLEKCSTGSSEHLSGKHYNSPASASSREEWQSRRRRSGTKSGTRVPAGTNLVNPTVGYECAADLSYPQSSGYHSVDGHDGEAEFDYQQSNDLSYTLDSQVDTYQESYLPYEESSEVTWSESYLCSAVGGVDGPFVQEPEIGNFENWLPPPGSADVPDAGFNVKRIGRAVLDFSSALRGALRKIEVPVAQNPGEETDFAITMPSDLPTAEMPSKPSCYDTQFEQSEEQTSGKTRRKTHMVDSSDFVRELIKNGSLNKSDHFSEHIIEEATKRLILESMDVSKRPPYSDKVPSCQEELAVCTDPISSSTAVLPPPESLTEQPAGGQVGKHLVGPAEGLEDTPADLSGKAQISQCTTTESLSVSLLADEPVAPEEQGETDVPLSNQLATDISAAEGDAGEPHVDLSQMDERRLKCLRGFQQILREKRETRRNLTSMTMSSFSQEYFEPDGSQDGDQLIEELEVSRDVGLKAPGA